MKELIYTMSSYKDLLIQREHLEKQIEQAKEKEFNAVVADIKQKMLDYGISAVDLGLARAGKGVKGRPRAGVAPKFRDPLSGSSWSGRGKPPKWIAGKNRDEFLIQK